jgi:natural product precursor
VFNFAVKIISVLNFKIVRKMKTLSKIKLNQFSKDELDQRALNALKGGCACTYGGGCARGCGSTTSTDGFLAMAIVFNVGSSSY